MTPWLVELEVRARRFIAASPGALRTVVDPFLHPSQPWAASANGNKDSGPAPSFERASRHAWACAFAALVLSLALSVGFALTRAPWWDEGLFADVAVSFRRLGHLCSSVLAPHSYFLPGINRYTYWQFPLYLVSLGEWFHIAPETVQSMRIFSVLWSCFYLVCWFLFTRVLTRDEKLSLFVTAAVAFDYPYLRAASDGRMEMMCAALGQAALAAYVCLRERNRKLALLTGGFFGAASFFCHPMGAVTSALLAALIIRDWRQMSFSDVVRLGVFYVVGGALCLWYILQAPNIFLAQFKAASGYRVGGIIFLLRNISDDLYTRYFRFYALGISGPQRLKGCALLFGAAGLAAITLNRRLRSTPFAKVLLLFSVIAYVGVAFVDDMKFPYYLVYVTPILSACGALWVYDSFQRRETRFQQIIASLLLVGSFGATTAAFARNIYRDELTTIYKPAVAAIKRTLTPGEIVIGPSQLGFALGFGRPLIDDCYLGYASGIEPQVYVMHELCGPPRGSGPRPWIWSRNILATHFDLVFRNQMYGVYVRKSFWE